MVIKVADTLTIESKKRKAEPNPFLFGSLENFFKLSLDMFFIAGFDGYFKQMNPMCEKILGYTTKEFFSQRWIDFIHPEDKQSTLEQLQKLTTGTDTSSFENRYRCKDGSYKWLLWNVSACQDEQLIYAVAHDRTEFKQAEIAHQESQDCFRLLVEGIEDYGIVLLDPVGYIVSWNVGAQSIKQYQASEMVGKHVSCLYNPEDISLGKLEQALEVAALQGRFEEEGWQSRKDGSRFWAQIVITSFYSDCGELRGFVKVIRDLTEGQLIQEALQKEHDDLEKRVAERTADLTKALELLQQEITERKRTEAALRESKTRLKKQAEQLESETRHAKSLLQELQRTHAQLIQTEKMSSLGQLIAGVAHEINNPVGFIYSNVDYASCYVKDLIRLVELYNFHYPQPVYQIQAERKAIDLDFLMVDLPKLLSSMKVGATRIRQVVLSLQNFLRAEQAKMKPVDIHQGLDSSLLLLQHRLKGTSDRPEITIFKRYGLLPLVECFAGQINQVFMNLLTNAVDVLEVSANVQESPRCITITTAVEEISTEHPGMSSSEKIPHVVIRIADNGPGMTEEVCRRLFDPFFTTKPVGKGTGLGLSISYHIVVDRHGGQLTCSSELGKGAEFSLAIPIRQPITNNQ